MKTAGIRFDFYDDPTGEILKKNFPTAESLPEIIKEAHILNPAEREVLRDEAYALVMNNDGRILRKFACVDAGNTLLSALYFEQTKDLLPAEAQEVAATKIAAACEEFGIKVALSKTAAKKPIAADGMSRKRDPYHTPRVSDDSEWSQRTNILSVDGDQNSGRVMDTASTLKTAGVVDVSGKSPELTLEKRASSRYAMDERYPLDSYADVQEAIKYFDDNWMEMDPADRHEYAVKTASRADELGIATTEILDRYGSTGYAPDVEAHISSRILRSPEFAPAYSMLREKRASISPDRFAELLSEIDTESGLLWYWGGEVADAYMSTFGGRSEAEKTASWSWEGSDGRNVNAEQLQSLAADKEALAAHFNDDFVTGFSQNPVQIFESMPDSHKSILARLATEN